MNLSGKTVSNEAMEEEWELIQAAKREPALFKPLYNQYYEQIFRFIFRRTADKAVAADLASQVFLKAMQKLSGYQYKGVPFSAWLYRIASNEVTQHFRNQQKNRVVSIEDQQIDHLTMEVAEEDVLDKYRGALLKALEELSEDDIQLIELRYFEKRPFKEIAEIIDIKESNAKVKTYRILEKLKKYIGKID